MTATAVLFLVGLLAAVLLGVAAPRWTAPARRLVIDAIDRLADRIGNPAALAAAAAIASVVVVVFGAATGFLAAALESAVDRPAFRWAVDQVDRSPGFFHQRWYQRAASFTKIGNLLQTRVLVVVACVVLAVLWRRRRPWVPVTVVVGTYLLADLGQKLLARIVDRGHPPEAFGIVTLGTFPSGGCMRIVAVWGIIAVFVVRTFPRAARWSTPALAALVAVGAWTEAYTRLYLLKHWLTDVIGALVLGSVILLLAAAIADRWIEPDHGSRPSPSR